MSRTNRMEEDESIVERRGLVVQMSPIQRGLKDRHPYVRRTAVMGVLKVYNFDADAVRNAGVRMAAPCPNLQQGHALFPNCTLPPFGHTTLYKSAQNGGSDGAAGMLETVREMLTQDADPMVVSNCMSVIQKVRPQSPVLTSARLHARLQGAGRLHLSTLKAGSWRRSMTAEAAHAGCRRAVRRSCSARRSSTRLSTGSRSASAPLD